MNAFAEWFARSPIASWLRTFVSIVLAMFIADGADVFAVDLTELRTWVAAGLASVLPLVVRWLNPADSAFGRGTPGKGDIHDVFGTEDAA